VNILGRYFRVVLCTICAKSWEEEFKFVDKLLKLEIRRDGLKQERGGIETCNER